MMAAISQNKDGAHYEQSDGGLSPLTPIRNRLEQELTDLKSQLKNAQESNGKMTDSLAKADARNTELKDKLSKVKQYSKAFKYCVAAQCKFCHAFWPTETFVKQHL